MVNNLIFLIFKSIIARVINYIILVFLKYISDKYFIFVKNDINYYSMYDLSDSSSDETIEPTAIPIEYINILKKFNITNVINKYTKNTNKHKLYSKDSYYIINSFLFNFKDTNITDKYIFTKKLIILFNRYGYMNTIKINELNDNYKYIYIFYKSDNNIYNVKIIDIKNNVDIIDNSNILFNLIRL